MDIKEVGYFYDETKKSRLRFFSEEYFTDAAQLIIRISELANELHGMFQIQKNGEISSQASKQLIAWIKHKTLQLAEFYQHGSSVTVIVDTNPLLSLRAKDGYSHQDVEVNFLKMLCGENFRFEITPFKGDSHIFDPLASDLTANFNSRFHFTFSYVFTDVITIATTRKTKDKVAIIASIGKGKLMILPDIYLKNPDLDSQTKRKLFLTTIKQTFSAFEDDFAAMAIDLPSWTNEVILTKQNDITDLSLRVQEKIQVQEAELLKLSAELDKYQAMRSIIATKGKYLEFGIKTCLMHLGIEFIVPEGNSTDLVLKYEDVYFAVEIKGTNGSASKAHVRQLEDWVNVCSKSYDCDDVKGILIINCFHDVAINARTETHFPDNVVEYSKPRNHCLVTTAKVLALVEESILMGF
ncbi:hypothetical protein [Pedobacter psychrodurus]|uniref:hypothetical protein n=1 Tax=Pedobacter psychrodurus TaxID=2530456 RepID=UPI00292E7815|nr:hypothetical protein [Pedobacter psychrodurus]